MNKPRFTSLAPEKEGYALVPLEPTNTMIEAFYSKVEIQKTGAIRDFPEGYKAMIQAAKEEGK